MSCMLISGCVAAIVSFEFHKIPFSRNLANGFKTLVFVVVLKYTLLEVWEGIWACSFYFCISSRIETKKAYMG